MTKAYLIYDGPCGFCTRWAHRLRAWAGPARLEIRAWEEPGALDLHPDLSLARALRAVQYVSPQGQLLEGAAAIAAALSLKPGFAWMRWIYALPLIRPLAEASYKFAARRRTRCETCGHQ